MGSYLLHLRRASFRPPRIKRLSAYFLTSIRGYNSQPNKKNNGHRMERARTTAEEFERVAEEFEKVAQAKARQGSASQTIGKANDGKEEAATGDSCKVESVKDKYKEESVGKGYFREAGN